MKRIATKIFIALLLFASVPFVQAKGDDFNSVVKMIEDFYRVSTSEFRFSRKPG